MDDKRNVRSMVEVAGWILDAAQADGLPIPGYVTINRHTVSVQLASREDVHAWAGWRGFMIEPEKPLADPERFIVRAAGQMYEARLDVYTVTATPLLAAVDSDPSPACGCGHRADQHSAIGCGANTGMGSVCRCVKSSGAVARDARVGASS